MFLTEVIDPAGNITTLNYTNIGNNQFHLTSVTDAMGRSTTFTYGLTNYPLLITKITDAFGRSSQLNYDSSQRLSSITDPIGITSSFTYGSPMEPNFITSLTTPYGISAFSDLLPTLDPGELNSRALRLTDPLGYSEFLYFYQNDGGSYYESSDAPNTVPSGMNTDNNLLEYRNTYYYDKHAFNYVSSSGQHAVTLNSSGNIQTEDPYYSHITHWVHDQYSQLATGRAPESIQPPLENRIWYNYPNQTQAPTPSIYSGSLDRPSAAGRVLDDGSTQLTQATYNGGNGGFGGKPTSITDGHAPPASGRTTTFTYASNNIDLLTVQQNTSSGPATIATFSNYNNQHEPRTYIGADGQTWQYSYNAAGQLATITDPNSGLTTFNYDSTSRLSTVQNASSGHPTVLTLTYDSADRVHTRTDSQGYTLTYSYDNLDRVTQITYPDGTSDVYDWTFQSGPLQGTPSLELRKHTDRLGRVTTYGYDADRRLTSVTEPLSSGTNRTTYYDYYENGVLKDITDADGNVTRWTIDLESRPVSKTYAYGTSYAETENLTYESTTSRLQSLTDALSQVNSYSYGADDRLTGITYSGNLTPSVAFAYDPYFPRLTSMADGTGTTNYSYVPIGTNGALQLASENGPFNNDSIGYTYDALGRMSARNIPGGNEGFTYDAISRLQYHSTGLGTFTYGYLGQTDQVSSRSVTNGGTNISTGWSYATNTNDRRLIGISNSGITRSYTLSYLIPGGGGANNPYDILSLIDTPAPGHPFGGDTHTITYDLSDRLLSETFVTPMDRHAYAYDPVDNATTVTIGANQTPATYNPLNEIKTWGPNNYFYDANGNTLSGDGTRSYKWDVENRLIEIDYIATGGKSQFSYDGLGRRIIDTETVGSDVTTSYYLWCDDGHLCQTRDTNENPQRRDFAEGEYNVTSTQKLIYMPDQLGSVRDVLDGTTGSLVDANDYAPYGSNDRSYGTTPMDYGFAGLLLHPTSGLNLGTYRALDGIAPGAQPSTLTGRFINRDPIGFGGGINLYDYTFSDPINQIDPLGLCWGSGKGRGKGERRWTSKPSKAAKGAQPVRDKNGKIVGWSIPSPDGKRTPKTLAWGLANGLDPKNFQTATEVGILSLIGGYLIYTAPEWAPYVFGSLAFF